MPHLIVSEEFELVESLRASESENSRLENENRELKLRQAKQDTRIRAIELYLESLKKEDT